MFMFPTLRIYEDGKDEYLLISSHEDLQKFVTYANAWLALPVPLRETGKKASTKSVDAITEEDESGEKKPSSVSAQRAMRIHEVARQLGRSFFAREIAEIVKDERLFITPGGDPVHVIRGAIRDHPELFQKVDDGSGASAVAGMSLESEKRHVSPNGLFQDERQTGVSQKEDQEAQAESENGF